jgi:hypothetical protein
LDLNTIWKNYKAGFSQHRGSIAFYLVFSVLWTGFGLEFKNGQEVITNLDYVLTGVIMISLTIFSPLLYLIKPRTVNFPHIGLIANVFYVLGFVGVLFFSFWWFILGFVGCVLDIFFKSKKTATVSATAQ